MATSVTSSRIAVFGLGRMGGPIARALAEHHVVVGYDPVLRPGDPLAIAASADVLVTVLPGAAEAALLEPVLAALPPGALWLDLTSSDPRVTESLALKMQEIFVVGAPMAGGPAAAGAKNPRF